MGSVALHAQQGPMNGIWLSRGQVQAARNLFHAWPHTHSRDWQLGCGVVYSTLIVRRGGPVETKVAC